MKETADELMTGWLCQDLNKPKAVVRMRAGP